MLTAEEGADRVAERYRKRPRGAASDVDEDEDSAEESEEESADGNDESTPNYTCENCTAHEFAVCRTFNVQRNIRKTLCCSCGDTDVAATRELVVIRTVRKVARLGADHRVNYNDEVFALEELENEESEEVELEINCRRCFEDADSADWESEEPNDWEEDEESKYYEVRCEACDHEIEFGWSHPNRVGRIWPCESSDFNPWLTFPELRFVAAWERRGWLRPKESRSRRYRQQR